MRHGNKGKTFTDNRYCPGCVATIRNDGDEKHGVKHNCGKKYLSVNEDLHTWEASDAKEPDGYRGDKCSCGWTRVVKLSTGEAVVYENGGIDTLRVPKCSNVK